LSRTGVGAPPRAVGNSTACLDRSLSFREKLEWLEEAETLTLQLRASREKRKAEGEGRTTEGKSRKPKAENS